MSEFVVITGASGHIGKAAAEQLASAGARVRAVVRNPEKLPDHPGIEPFEADLKDPVTTEKAFRGARAVFAMIPPNVSAPDVRADQNHVADCLLHALRGAKVTHVVALSSLGAHQGTGMGPVNGLHDWEVKLQMLQGVNVLVLRPAYFMENLLMNVDLIKQHGIMGSPLQADVRQPMVATADIAAVVADALQKRDFKGFTVRELHGQRDVSMSDARQAIATAIGRPDLPYVQFPYADAQKAMMGMGLSENYAALIIEMSRAINEGTFKPAQPRDARTTTPTSIESFARVFTSLLGAPAPAGR